MSSVWPWWWLALPLLLLPIWWHRQKRERQQTEPLASARFLPATAPQQQRVWRWTETLLLLLRCVLLSVLIAWLADTVLAWREDTVLLAPAVDAVWAEQQMNEAGMGSAERVPICSPAENCASILDWVAQHERAWRPSARLLLIAKAEQLPLTAHLPQLAHPLILRVQEASTGSASSAPTPPRQRHITLVTNATRRPQWLALFAAFELAGTGSPRTVFDSEPNAQTELLIWDDATSAPPTNWRAPLWWIAAAPVLPEAAQTTALRIEGIDLRYADSARGRFWFSSDWPPRDAQTLRGLHASWQLLTQTTAAYPVTNQTLPAPIVHSASAAANFFTSLTAGSAGSAGSSHEGKPSSLAWLLIILFVMERGLTHARRI